jgi:predicted ATP-grasp superfamily ATP-dependent carboligase
MRIFVFESLSAGPLDAAAARLPQAASLLREGQAMLAALADDFAAVPGIDVVAVVEEMQRPRFAGVRWRATYASHPTERLAAFDRLTAASDWTIVIAPEIGGELALLARRVHSAGGRLLGPSVEAIELLGDKHRTAELLKGRGVPVCRGMLLPPGPLDDVALCSFSFPAFVKPVDGAGSVGVRLVRSADGIEPSAHPRRLERYAPGKPVSAAVLCGPNGDFVLPPCSQRLSDDGRFAYRGGDLPLPPHLAARAMNLAKQAADATAGLLGYLGVDMVLGDDICGDSCGDVVIEINPRLTTSYVGLRRLCESNLAAAMLDVASNRAPGALRFLSGRVEFDSSGAAHFAPCAGDEDKGLRPSLAAP